jgi:hypothetical protein
MCASTLTISPIVVVWLVATVVLMPAVVVVGHHRSNE